MRRYWYYLKWFIHFLREDFLVFFQFVGELVGFIFVLLKRFLEGIFRCFGRFLRRVYFWWRSRF